MSFFIQRHWLLAIPVHPPFTVALRPGLARVEFFWAFCGCRTIAPCHALDTGSGEVCRQQENSVGQEG